MAKTYAKTRSGHHTTSHELPHTCTKGGLNGATRARSATNVLVAMVFVISAIAITCMALPATTGHAENNAGSSETHPNLQSLHGVQASRSALRAEDAPEFDEEFDEEAQVQLGNAVQTQSLSDESSRELAPPPQARLQTLKAMDSNEAGCVEWTHHVFEQWKPHVCAPTAAKTPHCSFACKTDLIALTHYHCSRGDHDKGHKHAKAFHTWDSCVEALQKVQTSELSIADNEFWRHRKAITLFTKAPKEGRPKSAAAAESPGSTSRTADTRKDVPTLFGRRRRARACLRPAMFLRTLVRSGGYSASSKKASGIRTGARREACAAVACTGRRCGAVEFTACAPTEPTSAKCSLVAVVGATVGVNGELECGGPQKDAIVCKVKAVRAKAAAAPKGPRKVAVRVTPRARDSSRGLGKDSALRSKPEVPPAKPSARAAAKRPPAEVATKKRPPAVVPSRSLGKDSPLRSDWPTQLPTGREGTIVAPARDGTAARKWSVDPKKSQDAHPMLLPLPKGAATKQKPAKPSTEVSEKSDSGSGSGSIEHSMEGSGSEVAKGGVSWGELMGSAASMERSSGSIDWDHAAAPADWGNWKASMKQTDSGGSGASATQMLMTRERPGAKTADPKEMARLSRELGLDRSW